MAFKDYSLNPSDNTALGDGTYIGPNMLRNKVRPALQQIAADGKELADEVDQLTGPLVVTSASGQSVSTRLLLTAITAPTAGQSATLTESGREGTFVFSTANLSAQVAADTLQGLYVAPSTDTTGASGAWVRKFSGPLDIRWFGGVGDALVAGTGTDNAPALNGAVAAAATLTIGCEILFPMALGHYRFSTAPNPFTAGVYLAGQGFHENPGTVNGVTVNFPQNYTGSVLRFDSDVKGLSFCAYTDNSADTASFEFQSSVFSRARDLMIVSMGGVGTTNHGVDLHVSVRFDNVRITGFAGNNLNVICSQVGSGQWGNADLSQFYNCVFDAAKLHGVVLDGGDANVIQFLGCRFANNGGAGTLDFTTVGCNSFPGCQYAGNNKSWDGGGLPAGFSAAQRAQVISDAPCLSDQMTGSAIQYRNRVYDGSDIGNISHYPSVYVEIGTGEKARLRTPTTVAGGFLSQTGYRHADFNALVIGGSELDNVNTFTQTGLGSNYTFNDAGIKITYSSPSDNTIPKLTLSPQAANFSQIAMLGNLGSAALGMDILAGTAGGFFSADSFTFRNAAQTTTFVTHSSSGSVFRGNITAVPAASATPASNGQMTFQLTSNTSLTIKVKGSDGVVRSVALTLA